MKQNLQVTMQSNETTEQARARVVTTPECLSASVLTICQNIDHSQINEMVGELSRQSAAIRSGDMARAESMLLAQAHTLDGLFAKLASQALTTNNLDVMERYMRLALKSQSQARATLQTLAEVKAPKQVAFVQQANIGNQVQVNNGIPERPARTRKKRDAQNELLEADNGKRLDGRATGATGGADPAMATLAKKHRTKKP